MSDEEVGIDELENASDYDDEVDELEIGPNEVLSKGDFHLRKVLPSPIYGNATTKKLHEMVHNGEIDVNPAYQRSVVWTTDRQSALIESIFLNYYVPPLLFAVSKDESGDPVRVCMDGKQRLTSINMFFSGQIPYRDPTSRKKFFYTMPEHQKGKRALIPTKYKEMFASKVMTFVEYTNISHVAERDIFQRVQMGMSLTAAEKLQAIESSYARWITSLDTKYVQADQEGSVPGLANHLVWDTKRGRNFQCLAQLVYCVEHLPDRSDPLSKKLDEFLRRDDPPVVSLKKRVENVIQTFLHIASTPGLNAPFKSMKHKVSPVEFVFIGILLEVLISLGVESDSFMSSEILNLRKILFTSHKDRRFNARVQATLWDHISETKKRISSQGRIYEKDSRPGLPNGKRKRGDDEGEDHEYMPSPVKGLGSAVTTRAKKTK